MKNKTALITGATGAIGSEIARLLAANQVDLMLHYNTNTEKALTIKQECEELGAFVTLFRADISVNDEIEKMFNIISESGNNPDILVNTVGISHYGLIQDISFQEWNMLLNTNVMSSFFCIKNCLPHMIRQKYGRIINISSIWGEVGSANESLYSLTKGSINSLTKSLAKELGPSGITVNAIAPGMVPSKMNDCFTNQELHIIKNEIPLHRFSKAIEIAQTVLHLIHPNSEYINGQIITIDGGFSLI